MIGNSTSRGRIILAQKKLFSAICETAMLHIGCFQRKFELLGKILGFEGNVGMYNASRSE